MDYRTNWKKSNEIDRVRNIRLIYKRILIRKEKVLKVEHLENDTYRIIFPSMVFYLAPQGKYDMRTYFRGSSKILSE